MTRIELSRIALPFQILRRHWWVYRRHIWSNISPSIADPMFFVLTFGIGLGAYVGEIDGRPYMQFMAPALPVITALVTSFFETSYGAYFRVHYEGIYKGMMTSPISVNDIIASEFLWVACKGAGLSTIVAIVLSLFGFLSWQYLWVVPLITATIGIGCGAIGLLAMTYVKSIDQFQAFYAFVIAPLYFLSGIFFPYSHLPPMMGMLIQISPLFHAARLLQETFWGSIDLSEILYHSAWLVGLSLILTLWAARRFRRVLLAM